MELVQACAIGAASTAAFIDLGSRRIPNWLTLGTLVSGILLNAWFHGFSGATEAVAGAALGLAMLLPFYAVRAIGAGDVKLLGAVGALLGPQLLVSVAIYAAIAGGVMSLAILAGRGRLLPALSEVVVQHRVPSRSGFTAPYGVAIAAGVYLSLFLPRVLS